MTPLQKLTRLAQIERQESEMSGEDARWIQMMQERRAILSSVGNPPPELANNPDAAAWALAMAETFDSIAPEQAFPWIDGFGSTVYDKGRENGTAEAIHHINAGTQGIIDCLRVIREGVKNGQVRSPPMDSAGGLIGLDEYITRTLKVAGLT